jgi:hypothetical protein
MITAQQAKELMETKREITKDDFLSRHSEYLEKLEKMIREQCSKEEGYFNIIIHDYDNFTSGDFDFLVRFLGELGYKPRTGDPNGNGRSKTIEIWWNK